MTKKEIEQMLDDTGFPYRYHHFEEGEEVGPPFSVWYFTLSNNFSADGKVYKKVNQLNIELYTDFKDSESERKLESALDIRGIFYNKTEDYLESEQMYEVLYEMEVIINAE